MGSPSRVSPSFLQIKDVKQTMQIVGYAKKIAKKTCTAAGLRYQIAFGRPYIALDRTAADSRVPSC